MTDLLARLKGVFVLAPLFIAAYFGNPFLAAALAIVLLLMSVELSAILANQNVSKTRFAMLVTLGAMLGALPAATPSFAPIGLILVLVALFILVKKQLGNLQAYFAVTVTICLASMSYLLFFKAIQPLIICLALIIAACDIGAYFIGRLIGGPKLAPAISPGKTISGAVGGLLSALLVAWLLTDYMTFLTMPSVAFGVICGLLSQAGDLFESAFKRKMNIKDSSQLIPGHGGVLDRFDGYLFLLPLIVLLLNTGGL